MSGIRTGLVVAWWNLLVEEHGGAGVATLARISVGRLDCHLGCHRNRTCPDASEMEETLSQRPLVLESINLGDSGGNEDRFCQRVFHWKELAQRILLEIYTLQEVIGSINERYVEGQGILFAFDAEGLDERLALVEKIVDLYNESLACDIELNGHGNRAG